MSAHAHQPALTEHDVELVDVGKPGARSTASGRCRRACRPASMRGGTGPRRSCRRPRRTRACAPPALRRQAPPGRVHLQERELDDIAVHARTPIYAAGPLSAAVLARGRCCWRPAALRRQQPSCRDRLLARVQAARRAARARAACAGAGLDAFGFMSAIQGSYTPEQTFLDMSAGARTTTSLYDEERADRPAAPARHGVASRRGS